MHKACVPFYENTCSSGGHDEKSNNTKFSMSGYFHVKGWSQMIHFLTSSIW